MWNETLNVPIPVSNQQNAQLEVAVMDEDMTSDDVAGQGIINVSHVGMYSPGKNDYVLRLVYPKKQKDDNNAGELVFYTRFVWAINDSRSINVKN